MCACESGAVHDTTPDLCKPIPIKMLRKVIPNGIRTAKQSFMVSSIPFAHWSPIMIRWLHNSVSLRGTALFLTATLVATFAAHARASGLLIADGGLGGVLQIERHDVTVVINNGIAVTQVHQVFRNTEQRTVEALYTFPVPAGASISNFRMLIGGRDMTGEVVEKKRAREIYNSYKAVKRDPGLLEQVDYRSFELRIFPIAAGAEQEIWLTWHQQLDFDHDTATWVYPLATTTRPDIDAKVHGRFSMTVDVKSEIPITKLFSPSH